MTVSDYSLVFVPKANLPESHLWSGHSEIKVLPIQIQSVWFCITNALIQLNLRDYVLFCNVRPDVQFWHLLHMRSTLSVGSCVRLTSVSVLIKVLEHAASSGLVTQSLWCLGFTVSEH